MQNLSKLGAGESDSAAMQRIAKQFDGTPHCTGDLCSYDFKQSFVFTDSGLLRLLRRTEWDYFGLRPWEVTAHIETTHGKINDIGLRTVVGRGRGWLYNEGLFSGNMWAWLMVGVRANNQVFEQDVSLQKEYARAQAVNTGHQITAGDNGIIVRKPNLDTLGGGEVLSTNVSLGAPSESRRTAFDINLRCTTAMSPCTELCQLTPSAWHIYSQFQKSNGWYVEEPAVCTPDTH